MALTDKLTAIADGFRTSRGTEQKYTLDEMAVLAAEKVGGGGAGLNIAYGDTAPDDTTKLWVKAEEPNVVEVTTGKAFTAGSISTIGTFANTLCQCRAVAVGKKVYQFGGYFPGGSTTDEIVEFDTETNAARTLTAKLPSARANMGAVAVVTKVYLFGGLIDSARLDEIVVFDAEEHTVTTLETRLPYVLYSMAVSAVGTKIYLFGGHKESGYCQTVLMFDTETNTVTTLGDLLPYPTYLISGATVGDKIYLFGGYGSNPKKSVLMFNPATNAVTTVSTSLPYTYSAAPVAYGDIVYLFGAGTATPTNAINVFDTTNNTITTLEETLPSAQNGIQAVLVGPVIYLFAGSANTDGTVNTIALSAPLNTGKMVLQYTTGGELFPVIKSDTLTIELCPASVHIGDASGVAQPVEVFAYKNGAWTAI